MTLKKRLDQLEGVTVQQRPKPVAIVRETMLPSSTEPELVAMTLRPRHGGHKVQIDRAPGETEAETRTRFAAMCSPDQRM